MVTEKAKLTYHKLRHLLYYYLHRGGKRTITAAAVFFGVSRQNAQKIYTQLSDGGYLAKGQSTVALTSKGLEVIREQRGYLEEIGISFEAAFDSPPDEAWLDAFQAIHMLPREKAAHIAKGVAFIRAFTVLRDLGPGTFNAELASGRHGIFLAKITVYKKGSRLVSMGDQGFRNPARLILSASGEAALELTTKIFRYDSLEAGRTLRGSLKQLWFKLGEQWLVAPEAQGRRLIPGGALSVNASMQGCRGLVQIRAEGTAPEMPRSLAEIYLEVDFSARFF
jgi:predicted transcriptional regulator